MKVLKELKEKYWTVDNKKAVGTILGISFLLLVGCLYSYSIGRSIGINVCETNKINMTPERKDYIRKVKSFRQKNPPKDKMLVCQKAESDYLKGKATWEVLECK